MQKPISDVDQTAVRVVIVTLDSHLSGATRHAERRLRKRLPNLELTLHAAVDWRDGEALAAAREAIENADIVIVTMLFMEEHITPVLPSLKARQSSCDAIVIGMSAGEVIKLTRLGNFTMDGKQGRAVRLLKRLRGGGNKMSANSGRKQLAMLKRLPRLLRFIPGTAQDLRAYFLVLQYWLAASDKNVERMVGLLINRYADGPRRHLRNNFKTDLPVEYPDVGLYHPAISGGGVGAAISDLPKAPRNCGGTVGVLLMRSYILAGDTAHYDAVIAALESKGLRCIPVFASGLDARPAIDRFFLEGAVTKIDALVSLTGFSLVGGPAYNDAASAEATLARLDVPYVAAAAVEFQSLQEWRKSDLGLLPIESTMMIALPELDGSSGHMVFGGRGVDRDGQQVMQPDPERVDTLGQRVQRLVHMRRQLKRDRRLAVVLFNFPPNSGSIGTAAHLSVFASLFNTLVALRADGYSVDVPESVDSLKDRILGGNARQFGAEANVHARIDVDDHVSREPWLDELESAWGPAPGKHQTDGQSIFVLGAQFGNVFVGIQPGFGYEGDPMRLLFEKSHAPTHAFAAFYTYIRSTFQADAVLHFGTHGALEFMPGKQNGLSGGCWPERLLGDLPNFYLYAANNPSEATIAKRRSAATLISYRTPPIREAGLYKGLSDLKASIERWRAMQPDTPGETREQLSLLIQSQAADLDIVAAAPMWNGHAGAEISGLWEKLVDYEQALVPHGLHVVGDASDRQQTVAYLAAIAEASFGLCMSEESLDALINGESHEAILALAGHQATPETVEAMKRLSRMHAQLVKDHETPAILHALEGRFIRPVAGGDVMRSPDVLPTGRNIHGFDPFKLPSRFAVQDGARQAERLIERHIADGNSYPESMAIVLWGTDNLKSEGAQIALVLALIGAEPRFDSYGRLAGASLVPLETLGRPRVDVTTSLSGIFRDLLPLQTRMLAEASYLAATADEPVDQNYIRKNTIRYQDENDCDLETAALRVFSNAQGAYGANVNHLIGSGRWDDEDELADAYAARKSFAYTRAGDVQSRPELLNTILGQVELTYQNLDSVELGVTTIDHYFDTLGGIGRAARRAKGEEVPVYIGDQTRGGGKVRSLSEQVALETRTRVLNPSWYESMLDHGFEGVRQIESHVSNTMGWSATTGQVEPWVYRHISETFVLDDVMRRRLASLNPAASMRMANRLLEAHRRRYWSPDRETLEALQEAGDELEDCVEGVGVAA